LKNDAPPGIERDALNRLVNNARNGSIIFSLMLGVLMVLGILAFSLNYSVSEKAHFMYAHSNSMLMDMAAFEIFNHVYAGIAAELRQPKSPLFLTLLKAQGADFPLTVPKVWTEAFSFQNRPDLPRITPAIEARIEGYAPLENGTWKDPWEKFFTIRLTVRLSLQIGTLRAMRKIYRVSRPGKIQSLVLPVVSKFTLFVSAPEPTNEKNPGYNCLRNTIDGKPLSPTDANKGVEAPIVLYHSAEAKMTDLSRAGFVFLGGAQDIDLHMTNGGDSQCGEIFQFYPMTQPRNSPPLYDLKVLPVTQAFQNPVSLASATVQGKLGIQQTFFGFYEQDSGAPPKSMNIDGALGYFFERTPHRPMDSSCLHLCGTFGNPSPGLVIGNVWRMFAVYSGLTINVDGDDRPDGLLTLLKQPAGLNSVNGSLEAFWNLLPLPDFFFNRKTGESLLLDQKASLKDLFGSAAVYLTFASTLMVEPYNQVYEYLTNETEGAGYPPSGKFAQFAFKDIASASYHFSGSAFEMKLAHAPAPFILDLHKIKGTDLLNHRLQEMVDGETEFRQRFCRGSELDLRGKTVLVKSGDLELPAALDIKSPGTIVVKGDVHLRGNLTASGKTPALTIISLDGTIFLDGSNPEIQAYLVALNRTVRPTQKTRVKIQGGLAVKSLIPAHWPAGGTITYDSRFDYTRPEREVFYSVAIGDYYSSWEMDMDK
jgi:hypothetical protein